MCVKRELLKHLIKDYPIYHDMPGYTELCNILLKKEIIKCPSIHKTLEGFADYLLEMLEFGQNDRLNMCKIHCLKQLIVYGQICDTDIFAKKIEQAGYNCILRETNALIFQYVKFYNSLSR